MTTMWALAIAAGCGSTKVPLGSTPGPTVTVGTTDDTGSGATEDNETTTAGDSGETDPDDLPPVDSDSPPVGDTGGPAPEVSTGPTDWTAVHAWMEEYAAQIRLAGACPTVGPDKVVQLDGSMAALALEAFEPVDTVGQARIGVDGDGSEFILIASEAEPSGVDDDDADCHDWTHGEYVSLEQGEMSFTLSVPDFPILDSAPYVFIASDSSAYRNDADDIGFYTAIAASIDYERYDDFTQGAGYALICLDEIVPPSGLLWSSSVWQGSVLLHTEYPDHMRSDVLWNFSQVDCAYAENAGVWVGEWSADRHHSDECDGLDNDLDGEVDEGAQDLAGNGIADCLEGIEP